jgi:hypothetical protein
LIILKKINIVGKKNRDILMSETIKGKRCAKDKYNYKSQIQILKTKVKLKHNITRMDNG